MRDAPWLNVLLDELISFPESRYSDQVDSVSQALSFEGAYDPGALADFYSNLADSYMFRYAMARGW